LFLSHGPRYLKHRSAASRLLRLRFRIPSAAWMSACCECCVLLGWGLCENWSLLQRIPTKRGAWRCVIQKPEEWGGRDPRWGAVPQEKTKLTHWSTLFPKKLTGPQISRDMPLILLNLQVHCCIHMHPPSVPIIVGLQINPVQSIAPNTLKINFNIILSSMPRCSKWSFALSASHQIPIINTSVPHTYYMPRPFHSSWFYHRTILGEEYRLLSYSLCSFLNSFVTSSLLGPNILINTLCICFLFSKTDQVLHPSKTPGQIIFL